MDPILTTTAGQKDLYLVGYGPDGDYRILGRLVDASFANDPMSHMAKFKGTLSYSCIFHKLVKVPESIIYNRDQMRPNGNLLATLADIQADASRRKQPKIKRVIFNDPATIVFWTDGSKTVVKAVNEPFDPEKGLAMAIAKKILGNQGNYYNELKKWLPPKEETAK